MKHVTAKEMQRLDRLAQSRYGIPSIILMENAGRTSAEEILKKFKKGRGAVFCGFGNNGGDGFVCARYLANAGIVTHVYVPGKISEIKKPDPATNLNILKRTGIRVRALDSSRKISNLRKKFDYDFAVDAVFGIGFRGELLSRPREIAAFLNDAGIPVYALDIPSGMNATDGSISTVCVKAYKTVTFGLPKKGFLRHSTRFYTGRLVVKDIGFPRQILH